MLFLLDNFLLDSLSFPLHRTFHFVVGIFRSKLGCGWVVLSHGKPGNVITYPCSWITHVCKRKPWMLLLCSQLRIVNRLFWYWVNCFIRFIGAPWASLPCNFSHPSICGWNSGMSVMRWTRVRKGSYGQQTYLFSVVKSQHILYRSTTWLQDFSWWKLSITVLRGMLCQK